MKQRKLLIVIISIMSVLIIASTGLIVYSLESNRYFNQQHDEAILVTKRIITVHEDSMLNEISTLEREKIMLRKTLSEMNMEIGQLQNTIHEKDHYINALADSIDDIMHERSELEQRYSDQ